MGFSHKRIFTEDELKLIANPQLSLTTLCVLVDASMPTVSKMRRELGIITIRGRREGVSMPGQRRTIHCVCQNPLCQKEIVTVKSTPRKFCSHSCQQKTENVAGKGRGSRKIRNPNTPEYKKYARMVHGISQEVYIKNIDIINPTRYPRTLCGVDGGWQLDHIIPIKECFTRGLPPEEAASLLNLRMLPWKDNLMRQYKK
jgi:hypothetical protein